MKKRAKRWMGALALAAGTLGTAFFLRRRKSMRAKEHPGHHPRERNARDRWARPGMSVTFRAELMPGRDRAARTFHVARLLPSSRVTLEGFVGEHVEAEFEPVRFN